MKDEEFCMKFYMVEGVFVFFKLEVLCIVFYCVWMYMRIC